MKTSFKELAGDWSGPSMLWLSPDHPVMESASTARVASSAAGRFLRLEYTWAYEGKPQDGLLIFNAPDKPAPVEAVWIDSFHVGDKYMPCRGHADDGKIDIKGSYAAPPGPDWGWRIVIHPLSEARFELTMYNVTPEGEESLAVRADYARRA